MGSLVDDIFVAIRRLAARYCARVEFARREENLIRLLQVAREDEPLRRWLFSLARVSDDQRRLVLRNLAVSQKLGKDGDMDALLIALEDRDVFSAILQTLRQCGADSSR